MFFLLCFDAIIIKGKRKKYYTRITHWKHLKRVESLERNSRRKIIILNKHNVYFIIELECATICLKSEGKFMKI